MSNENYKFYNRKTIFNFVDFAIMKEEDINLQNCTIYYFSLIIILLLKKKMM